MGVIGNHLPKPLWPIFEKTLLELQFEFHRHLDIKQKFINTHYQAEKIHNFATAKLPQVNVLHESKILDVGGAILNLKKHSPELNYVLISNVDQFLFLDWAAMKKRIAQIEPFTTLLFATRVHKDQGYGQLDISPEGKFLGVKKKPTDDSYLTYSGTSLVNCSKINSPPQKIDFFQSIAHPTQQRVQVVDTKGRPYYDFGTLCLYLKEMMKISKHLKTESTDPFLSFLKETNTIEQKKTNQSINSYQSNQPNEYRFQNIKINLLNPPSIQWIEPDHNKDFS